VGDNQQAAQRNLLHIRANNITKNHEQSEYIICLGIRQIVASHFWQL
jgi:hypothetical protein